VLLLFKIEYVLGRLVYETFNILFHGQWSYGAVLIDLKCMSGH